MITSFDLTIAAASASWCRRPRCSCCCSTASSVSNASLAAGRFAGRDDFFHGSRNDNHVLDHNLDALKAEWIAKGVRYCVGAYVDIHGVPKAKVVPIDHLGHMAGGSERYTGYALDGLGQDPHDDEIVSIPDLARAIQLPWEPKVVWMPADNAFQGSRIRSARASS